MLSQSSSSHMESPINHGIPPNLNGHYLSGLEAASIPDQQCNNNTGRKKSKVRLNDQLVPKPTDINMVEKMIKIATPKCHPHTSHISRFEMFPSFRSRDEPETGVRSVSQPFLNPLITNSSHGITVLSKTKGNPYRHEVLHTPMKTREKAVMWSGEHLNHTKERDFSLSERTRNMMIDLEKAKWVTSYQMHHTCLGKARHLKTDIFNKNISSDVTETNSNTAPLKESSCPVYVPEPRGGCGGRQQGSTCRTTAAELPNLSPNRVTDTKSSVSEGSRRENCKIQFDESPIQIFSSQSSQEANAARIVGTERPLDLCSFPLSQEEREVNREKNLIKLCMKDDTIGRKEYIKAGRNVTGISQSSVAKELAGIESHAESSRAAPEQEMLAMGRELPCSSSKPFIPLRPPVLPGIHPVDGAGTVGGGRAALCLLDLQDSFSKSNAHRNFNISIPRDVVNLRDNVDKGKKHDFYGLNCYYLHG